MHPNTNHDGILAILTRCRKCPHLVESRDRVVPGYGDAPADFMFVGLAPGRNGADITGVPFTKDPSGVLFQEALIRVGFSLEESPRVISPRLRGAFVTNIVKCNPKDIDGNNRAPSVEEIAACSEYFESEKRLVNPRVIISFGKTVTESLLSRRIANLSDLHGVPIQHQGITYLPMIHPSFVIRGAYDRRQYLEDFDIITNLNRPGNC